MSWIYVKISRTKISSYFNFITFRPLQWSILVADWSQSYPKISLMTSIIWRIWEWVYTLPWASQVALEVNNPPCNEGDGRDAGFTSGSGRSPGGGYGNPLQYSCLENPMGRGPLQATVHRIAKSRTWLKTARTHTYFSASFPLYQELRVPPSVPQANCAKTLVLCHLLVHLSWGYGVAVLLPSKALPSQLWGVGHG